MSIFGSVTTAVSGLNAQSKAFSNLGNNIANSQTTGYKATTTSFEDLVPGTADFDATAGGNDSVRASTVSRNDVQGTITSSENALALAISGNGFFNVQEVNGDGTSASPDFSAQQYYTRNGDFSQNAQGYLVNTSGAYLDGYQVGADGALSTTLAPLRVQNVTFQPTETTTMTLSSVIGSTTTTGASNTATATAYNASGKPQDVKLDWTQSATDPLSWTVSNAADHDNATQVTFSSDGSLASVGDNSVTGSNAVLAFKGAPQAMTVDLGTIGQSGGVSLSSTGTGVASNPVMTTDSVTSGTFQGLTMESDGSVMASFDNGKSQMVGKIPLTTFTNVNGLTARDGQTYVATAQSGNGQLQMAGSSAAGSLKTGSIESSTTDLTSDLSQLIVAQQAYGANTKVVTTADQLLQTTIAMIQ